MRRFVVTLVVAVLLNGWLGAKGAAASGWCRTDPIISLNGHQASIWVVSEVFPNWLPGTSVQIHVEYPRGVTASLDYIDPNHGFSAFSFSMWSNRSLSKGANWVEVKISVRVLIPHAPGTAAGVEWAMNASGYPIAAATYGLTDQWLVLGTTLAW